MGAQELKLKGCNKGTGDGVFGEGRIPDFPVMIDETVIKLEGYVDIHPFWEVRCDISDPSFQYDRVGQAAEPLASLDTVRKGRLKLALGAQQPWYREIGKRP